MTVFTPFFSFVSLFPVSVLSRISARMVVARPTTMEQPVPISAAHNPESVIPASKGGISIRICGSAVAASAPGIRALAATPRSAQINPIGIMSRAPSKYPLFDALSSFPVSPICTTPCTELVVPISTMIQLAMPIHPIPAVGLR